MWQEAVDILDELIDEQPDNPAYQYELGLLYVMKLKRGNQIIPIHRLRQRLDDAVKICRNLYNRYQHVTDYKKLLALALYNRTELDLRATIPLIPERLDYADELIREAILLQRSLSNQFPDSLEHKIILSKSLYRLSDLHDRVGRIRDAQKVLKDAIKDFERFLDNHPEHEESRRILIDDYEYLGVLFKKTGQPQLADEAFDKVEQLSEKFEPRKPLLPPPNGPPPNGPPDDQPK